MFNNKTKTLHLFASLWYIYAFSFSAVNENADENEIPFMAENETKTKMDIHFRTKNENGSHLLILMVLVDGIPLSTCTMYRYLCGSSQDDISTHKLFAFLLYCYRVEESNFSQSLHNALLASVSVLSHCAISCSVVYCNRSCLCVCPAFLVTD